MPHTNNNERHIPTYAQSLDDWKQIVVDPKYLSKVISRIESFGIAQGDILRWTERQIWLCFVSVDWRIKVQPYVRNITSMERFLHDGFLNI